MSHSVIQWGTGNVGFHSLRHIIRHPQLELVGVHAHNPEKIGKDAAHLCGLSENTGVIATNDIDALLSLHADVVVYTVKGETRPHEVIPELERILGSGANVASTAMDAGGAADGLAVLLYSARFPAGADLPQKRGCELVDHRFEILIVDDQHSEKGGEDET